MERRHECPGKRPIQHGEAHPCALSIKGASLCPHGWSAGTNVRESTPSSTDSPRRGCAKSRRLPACVVPCARRQAKCRAKCQIKCRTSYQTRYQTEHRVPRGPRRRCAGRLSQTERQRRGRQFSSAEAPFRQRAHPCALWIADRRLLSSAARGEPALRSLSDRPPRGRRPVRPQARRHGHYAAQPRRGALPALSRQSPQPPAAAGRRAPRPGSARPPAQPSPECSAADAGGASLLSGGARGEGGGGRGGPTTAGRCNTRLGAGPVPGAPLVLCDSLPILFGSPHALAQSPKPDRRTSPTGAEGPAARRPRRDSPQRRAGRR